MRPPAVSVRLLLCLAFVMQACMVPDVRDVRLHPQTPSSYVAPASGQPLTTESEQARLSKSFLERHFRPWDRGFRSAGPDLFWGVARYRKTEMYDAGGRKRPIGWFEALVEESGPEGFPNEDFPGVTVRTTSLRVMPTSEGGYLDRSKPGEGYPFDYFQNSALWANTPVRVSHVSRSGAWVLVESALASGWLPVQDVAQVDGQFMNRFRGSGLVALTRDIVHARELSGRYRFSAGIGSLHPVAGSGEDGWRILTAAMDEKGSAVAVEAWLPSEAAQPFPLQLTATAVAGLADRMAGQPYGWGGLDQRRDCSALLRDLFAGFGVWLPRNSAQQAKVGTVVPLDGLSQQEKERIILEKGVPFATLLWKRGHIMLYVGASGGRPMVWHQIWGMRSWDLLGGEGRTVIGRAAVTTLTPGAERVNLVEERSLLATLGSMNILVQ
jgi:cell wall-associated NlpC family hydrolase